MPVDVAACVAAELCGVGIINTVAASHGKLGRFFRRRVLFAELSVSQLFAEAREAQKKIKKRTSSNSSITDSEGSEYGKVKIEPDSDLLAKIEERRESRKNLPHMAQRALMRQLSSQKSGGVSQLSLDALDEKQLQRVIDSMVEGSDLRRVIDSMVEGSDLRRVVDSMVEESDSKPSQIEKATVQTKVSITHCSNESSNLKFAKGPLCIKCAQEITTGTRASDALPVNAIQIADPSRITSTTKSSTMEIPMQIPSKKSDTSENGDEGLFALRRSEVVDNPTPTVRELNTPQGSISQQPSELEEEYADAQSDIAPMKDEEDDADAQSDIASRKDESMYIPMDAGSEVDSYHSNEDEHLSDKESIMETVGSLLPMTQSPMTQNNNFENLEPTTTAVTEHHVLSDDSVVDADESTPRDVDELSLENAYEFSPDLQELPEDNKTSPIMNLEPVDDDDSDDASIPAEEGVQGDEIHNQLSVSTGLFGVSTTPTETTQIIAALEARRKQAEATFNKLSQSKAMSQKKIKEIRSGMDHLSSMLEQFKDQEAQENAAAAAQANAAMVTSAASKQSAQDI